MVTIILVSFNEGHLTRDCVASIRRNVTISHEIIIVDNCSGAETQAILGGLQDVTLIKNTHNAGFPAGCNRGLAAAKGDLVWFLNNDTYVPPGSLERMVELLLSDENIGMVGPVSNNVYGIQKIPVDYTDPSGIDVFAARVRREFFGQTWRTIRLVGFSMLLRKAKLDRLGGLDERMGIGIFEDDDLSLRLVANGYRLLVAKDAFIHHIGNASFRAAGGYPPTGALNQSIASTTFGMTIPLETILNSSLLERLDSTSRKILHVECGAGAFGLWAQEQGKVVSGFESSEMKYRIAKNHYDTCRLYRRGEPFSFEGTGYDALVLEKQLNDGETLEILRSLLPSLTAGAQILVQVPFLTAQHGEVFSTYLDAWDDAGARPLTGRFDMARFRSALPGLGIAQKEIRVEEERMGFFYRCAFDRYQMTEDARDPTAFGAFKCCTMELEKLP